MAHLGSCNLSEAHVALDSLLALAKSQAGLQEHADALATSMLERLEFFDTAQIHKVGCQVVVQHVYTQQYSSLMNWLYIYGTTQLQTVGCPHQLAASHLQIQGCLDSHNRQCSTADLLQAGNRRAAADCNDAGASMAA